MNTAIVAGIYTILGVLVSQGVTWLDRQRQEDRAARIAKADRLARDFDTILAATWTIERYANPGSWQGEPTQAEEDLLAQAEHALVRLTLEGGPREIIDTYQTIRTRFSSWQRNRQLDQQPAQCGGESIE